MENGSSLEITKDLAKPMQGIEDNESEEAEESLKLTETAPPFVFPQQEVQEAGDETSETTSDSPGTYHIIAQQLISSGQVQLTLSDGVNILQTNIAADQLHGFEAGEQSILLQAADVDASGEISYIAAGEVNQSDQEQITITTNDAHSVDDDTGLQASQSEERILQVVNQSATTPGDTVTTNQTVQPGNFFILSTDGDDKTKTENLVIDESLQTDASVKQLVENIAQQAQMNDMGSSLQTESNFQSTTDEASQGTGDNNEASLAIPEKKPDLTKPIEVTDHMEVVVNGKKCLLKINPDTGQLCAYPIVASGGKKRGRPRKSEMIGKVALEESEQIEDDKADIKKVLEPDQTNSAAQGLLELSNTGPDGIRRSGRNRGKPKTLQEYEVFELSSDDDAAAADDGDDDVLPSGAVKKKKAQQNKDYVPPTNILAPTIKRGRGRPRRYPRPEDAQLTNQIPAVVIPSGDGQSLMMAPIQGLTNIEGLQEQVKNLPIFQQLGSEDDSLQYLNISGLIDSTDTSIVNAQLGGDSSLADVTDENSVLGPDPLNNNDNDITNDNNELKTELGTVIGDTDMKLIKTEVEQSSQGNKDKFSESGDGQPTIIQIPENLLPMFTQKKDPIKIGLKASNAHLEKLKCQSCDFQGYYEHQYQDHIVIHDNVLKCKCCKFASFDRQLLIEHFKKNHPRCICTYCDHMAEHAYIIKRHIMRHTQIGCKCDVCGKVYKDQYVLKMHVKMVHMPAEVLFECNICSKKFTRKAHLKRHLRIHDPEKPFKCPQCSYRGCEKSDIVKHMLVHEEPRHQCPICNKSFRHIKNKELHMKRHSGQRDYKCGVCDFYGYTFTDIRKHIERKHTDCNTFICDKCGNVFRTEQLLKEHRAQVCDVIMIEQALAIARSDGGMTRATIQIPSNYSIDGNQQLQSHGQDGQITVGLAGETISLTDEQIQAVANGQINEADLQSLVNHAQLSESELQAVVSQGRAIHTVQTGGENITVMTLVSDDKGDVQGETVKTELDLYKSGSEDNGDVREMMYKSEVEEVNLTEGDEEEEEGETTMDEDDLRDDEEHMEDIVSDTEDKTNIDNDQIMGMVNIIR